VVDVAGAYQLIDPDPAYHRSFLTAADEFVAAGQESYAGLVRLPAEDGFPGAHFTRAGLEQPDEFVRLVDYLLRGRLEDSPRPAGWVPATAMWVVEGEEYLGRVSVRHRLTDDLLTWGGHIGYGVRPSARRRGVASFALGAVLPLCHALGIDRALVTCDVDNAASRRTIERNFGVYEDTRQGKLRYWVPTR
jgi:predicted acetyltransferase